MNVLEGGSNNLLEYTAQTFTRRKWEMPQVG